MNEIQLMQQGGMALRETASTAVAAQAVAAIQARCVMARANPRNWDTVRDKLLRECRRPSFAEAAIYRVPRGGKHIEGPSIRYVEVAIRAMGNIDAQQTTLFDDDEKRITRVTVLDIETNASYSREITIKKVMERKYLKDGQTKISERKNSQGETVYIVEITEDELMLREAQLVSKAIRTLGERFIPGDLTDEALEICRETSAKQDRDDPERARHRLLDAFSKLGVSPSDIINYLGHATEQMNPAEISNLREIYRAIKDETTTWSEVIAPKDEEKDRQKKNVETTKKTGARGQSAIINKILDLKLQNPERYQLVCTSFSVPHKKDEWMKDTPEDILGDFLSALMKEGEE